MQLIRDLERTRDETLKYFSFDEGDLARTYARGKWSVRFLLHHLVDSETVLYDRICRVLSEPRQVLWWYDEDAWAQDSTMHSVTGVRTLKDEFGKGASHTEHHLEQIRLALRGRS